MKLYPLLLVLGLSCSKSTVQPSPTPPQDPPKVITAPPWLLDNAVVLCLGNSLTYGYLLPSASESYPSQLLDSAGKDVAVINNGRSGYSTEQLFDFIPTDVTPFYKPGLKNIAVIWEIGNSIYKWQTSGDSAYHVFVRYCNEVRKLGWKIVVVTVPYRNNDYLGTQGGEDSLTFSSKISRANDSLRTNYRSFADGIADIAADPRLKQYDSTYYFPDHVHLKGPGYTIVAKSVLKSIEGLY